MNRYGQMALDHYQRHHPDQLAALDDPISHFTDLGDQTQTAITDLRDQILGPQRPGENPASYRSRGRQALRQATEIVLTELLPAPADTHRDPTDQDPALDLYRADLALINDQLSRLAADWTSTGP